MSESCTLTIHRIDAGYLIRVVGSATMRESPTVRDFASGAMEDGARIVLDLSSCSRLDSTFLGCLVLLHQRGAAGNRAFSVFADESTRKRLLTTVQLHRMLDFVGECPPCIGQSVELPVTELERTEFCQHLMEAHRRLAELGGPASETFRRIVDQLQHELKDR